jgi:protein phosphatase
MLVLGACGLLVLFAAADEPGKKCKDDLSLKLNVGKRSLVGTVREFNEDAVAVKQLPGLTLFLIAHGMGGKVGGKVLGQMASERAFEIVTKALKEGILETTTPDQARLTIRRALVAANREVMALSDKHPDRRVMGATIVLALWRPRDGMYTAGVGDCRAYLIRGETIEQLTTDHSLAQALVESKAITAEEAKTHRFRNVLWKYLGSKEVGDGPEAKLVALRPRDRVMLCTHGLHQLVADKQIVHTMRRHGDAQKCADALGQSALDAGSRFNISCIVLDVVKKD